MGSQMGSLWDLMGSPDGVLNGDHIQRGYGMAWIPWYPLYMGYVEEM